MDSTFDYIFNDPELLKMIHKHDIECWIKNIYKRYIKLNSPHRFYVSDQETANYYISLISKVIELMNIKEKERNVAPTAFQTKIKFNPNAQGAHSLCATISYYKDESRRFEDNEN